MSTILIKDPSCDKEIIYLKLITAKLITAVDLGRDRVFRSRLLANVPKSPTRQLRQRAHSTCQCFRSLNLLFNSKQTLGLWFGAQLPERSQECVSVACSHSLWFQFL